MLKIKTSAKHTSKDRGARHILNRIDNVGQGVYVETGIFEAEGSRLPRWKGENVGNTPIATYAFFNEYGTKDIPARPAFRLALTSNMKALEEFTITKMRGMYNQTQYITSILDALAKRTLIWTKQSIRRLDIPANSRTTLYRKKRLGQGSSPLLATKSMYRAVRSRAVSVSKPKKNHLRPLFEQTDKALRKLKP